MVFGLNLVCTDDTGEAVRRLWDEAGAFELVPSMRALNYPVHLTLAVYKKTLSEKELEAVTGIFQGSAAIELEFTQISFFENEFLVLWLQPEFSETLLHFHSALHREIGPDRCHAHYRPGFWQPHCTIANKIPQAIKADAKEWASTKRIKCAVTFDAVDFVSYPPVEILTRIWPRNGGDTKNTDMENIPTK